MTPDQEEIEAPLLLRIARLEEQLDRHDERVARMRDENRRLWERLRKVSPAAARTARTTEELFS